MDLKRYDSYKGFLICGRADFDSGRWRSMAIIEKSNCVSEGFPISPLCESPPQAITQALEAARAMVDSNGFRLKVNRDPDQGSKAGDHQEDALDEALIESFPASDPVAVAFPSAPLQR